MGRIESELLFEAMDAVKSRYVTDPDRGKMTEDAISGMVMGLDPFSRYVRPGDVEDEESYIEGSYIGIGVEVALKDGVIEVVTPLDGGPAKRAGIRSGDLIEEINGDQLADLAYDDAVDRLRGPEGTRVTLGIGRPGAQDLLQLTLTRERVEIKSVSTADVDGAVVIRISSFQRSTSEEFRAALARAVASKPKKGLVIDLRDNPGGLIDQAVKTADQLLKKGKIVYTKGRDERENALYLAKNDKSEPKLPLAALVNRGSASAAELLSGALKDRGRALVVGEKTFGKGSVQSIIELSNGGFLRLTTALYYTPSGVSIHKNGIVPDVVVAMEPPPLKADGAAPSSTAAYDLAADPQLGAAIDLLSAGRCPAAESESE